MFGPPLSVEAEEHNKCRWILNTCKPCRSNPQWWHFPHKAHGVAFLMSFSIQAAEGPLEISLLFSSFPLFPRSVNSPLHLTVSCLSCATLLISSSSGTSISLCPPSSTLLGSRKIWSAKGMERCRRKKSSYPQESQGWGGGVWGYGGGDAERVQRDASLWRVLFHFLPLCVFPPPLCLPPSRPPSPHTPPPTASPPPTPSCFSRQVHGCPWEAGNLGLNPRQAR